MKFMVSGCLLGENCKYNGGNNYDEVINDYLKDHEVVSVCPEVFGGLPTPRHPSEIVNGIVTNDLGISVDDEFRKGANMALAIAEREKIDAAILQSRSPSCGAKQVYDGTFSGTKIDGQGIFAKQLMEKGYLVLDKEDFIGCMKYRMQKATHGMEQELLEFYHSMVGTPFCAWNMEYPGMIEIERDLRNGTVYYCRDEKGIVATISIDEDEEVDALPIWNISNGRELARLGVRPDLRNQGIARKMMWQMFLELKSLGYDGVHIIVSPSNIAALNSYSKLGFTNLGKAEALGMEWICFERKLSRRDTVISW